MKRIDKIRRGFLWKGAEQANGGHCLVRWTRVCLPKELGGLGILNLELFGRALRLRWLWFAWTEPDRPWVGTQLPCDETDRQFFRASTVVQLGDGNTAKFWQCSWLNGQAPRDIAPNLYKLVWRKYNTVKEDITDHHWTRGLWRMTSAIEMAEFVLLWDVVQQLTLDDNPDTIRWKWTNNGIYTAKSAYRAQLHDTYCTFNISWVWKAFAEGKHKFFTWLLLQHKIMTADKLLIRNWPCNEICSFCDQEPETAPHLCLTCYFAVKVWIKVKQWTGYSLTVPNQSDLSFADWWHSNLATIKGRARRNVAAVIMFTVWHIWTERNRRVFEGKTCSPGQVFGYIREDIALHKAACKTPEIECDFVPQEAVLLSFIFSFCSKVVL